MIFRLGQPIVVRICSFSFIFIVFETVFFVGFYPHSFCMSTNFCLMKVKPGETHTFSLLLIEMSALPTFQPQLSMFSDPQLFGATVSNPIIGSTSASAAESASLLQMHGRQQTGAALLQQHLRMRKEIYRYTCDEPLFAAAWSNKLYPDKRFRLAVGTLLDEGGISSNKVYIIELDENVGELVKRFGILHGYPCTATQFIPNTDISQPELFATTSNCLRIFRYHPTTTSISQECELSSKEKINKIVKTKSSTYSLPLTNLDWNEVDSTLVATCSIDTTCTVWNIETSQPIGQAPSIKGVQKTQLIAHEKPVHDIAFTRLDNGRDQFATAGADGSIRLFDLRTLQHSTILYEDGERRMLNHLSWNKRDPTKLATVAQDSKEVIILDVRIPCRPMAKFGNHRAAINGITWAPHSTVHLCTAGSDRQALIWQMNHFNRDEPILAYTAESEICQIHWSSNFQQWISICFENSMEILRV